MSRLLKNGNEMMTIHKKTIWILLVLISPVTTWAAEPEISVNVGNQQILLGSGQYGLNYFPDQPVSVISQRPLRCFMTVENYSVAFHGRDWNSLRPVKTILTKGQKGSFDNSYAGVGGVYVDGRNVFLFYHAEDHEGLPKEKYYNQHSFIGSVALAVSRDGDNSFRKLGQILTAKHPKKKGSKCGGVGDISICVDKTNTYLLAHYVDYSRFTGRGVQTCVARSKISDKGKPGTWKKYFNGRFSEPGLGGRESHILSWFSKKGSHKGDAYSPHVVYSKHLGKYLMVFNGVSQAEVVKGKEVHKPKVSGIYLTSSDDAIHWDKATQLFAVHTIFIPRKHCVVHPSIYIISSSKGKVRARLLYGYTPRWWGNARDGGVSHHLASRMLAISMKKGSTTTSKQPKLRTKPVALESLRKLAKSVKVNAKGEVVALDLTGVSLNESHLAAIGTLRFLRSLALPKTNLTDDGLKTVGKLPNLAFLSIGRTRISSDGLRHLKRLKNLKGLRIFGNKGVGDSGVAHLMGMKTLTVLQINNTAITKAGVQKLKRALPNCRIIH